MWLNEGFASYMQYFGAQHFQNYSAVSDEFVLHQTQSVMRDGKDFKFNFCKIWLYISDFQPGCRRGHNLMLGVPPVITIPGIPSSLDLFNHHEVPPNTVLT